jgi:hypothetical protein
LVRLSYVMGMKRVSVGYICWEILWKTLLMLSYLLDNRDMDSYLWKVHWMVNLLVITICLVSGLGSLSFTSTEPSGLRTRRWGMIFIWMRCIEKADWAKSYAS